MWFIRVAPEQVGQQVRCKRCGGRHVLEQPYADRTTAERDHLYVTCGTDRMFVGLAAKRATRPATDEGQYIEGRT